MKPPKDSPVPTLQALAMRVFTQKHPDTKQFLQEFCEVTQNPKHAARLLCFSNMPYTPEDQEMFKKAFDKLYLGTGSCHQEVVVTLHRLRAQEKFKPLAHLTPHECDFLYRQRAHLKIRSLLLEASLTEILTILERTALELYPTLTCTKKEWPFYRSILGILNLSLPPKEPIDDLISLLRELANPYKLELFENSTKTGEPDAEKPLRQAYSNFLEKGMTITEAQQYLEDFGSYYNLEISAHLEKLGQSHEQNPDDPLSKEWKHSGIVNTFSTLLKPLCTAHDRPVKKIQADLSHKEYTTDALLIALLCILDNGKFISFVSERAIHSVGLLLYIMTSDAFDVRRILECSGLLPVLTERLVQACVAPTHFVSTQYEIESLTKLGKKPQPLFAPGAIALLLGLIKKMAGATLQKYRSVKYDISPLEEKRWAQIFTQLCHLLPQEVLAKIIKKTVNSANNPIGTVCYAGGNSPNIWSSFFQIMTRFYPDILGSKHNERRSPLAKTLTPYTHNPKTEQENSGWNALATALQNPTSLELQWSILASFCEFLSTPKEFNRCGERIQNFSIQQFAVVIKDAHLFCKKAIEEKWIHERTDLLYNLIHLLTKLEKMYASLASDAESIPDLAKNIQEEFGKSCSELSSECRVLQKSLQSIQADSPKKRSGTDTASSEKQLVTLLSMLPDTVLWGDIATLLSDYLDEVDDFSDAAIQKLARLIIGICNQCRDIPPLSLYMLMQRLKRERIAAALTSASSLYASRKRKPPSSFIALHSHYHVDTTNTPLCTLGGANDFLWIGQLPTIFSKINEQTYYSSITNLRIDFSCCKEPTSTDEWRVLLEFLRKLFGYHLVITTIDQNNRNFLESSNAFCLKHVKQYPEKDRETRAAELQRYYNRVAQEYCPENFEKMILEIRRQLTEFSSKDGGELFKIPRGQEIPIIIIIRAQDVVDEEAEIEIHIGDKKIYIRLDKFQEELKTILLDLFIHKKLCYERPAKAILESSAFLPEPIYWSALNCYDENDWNILMRTLVNALWLGIVNSVFSIPQDQQPSLQTARTGWIKEHKGIPTINLAHSAGINPIPGVHLYELFQLMSANFTELVCAAMCIAKFEEKIGFNIASVDFSPTHPLLKRYPELSRFFLISAYLLNTKTYDTDNPSLRYYLFHPPYASWMEIINIIQALFASGRVPQLLRDQKYQEVMVEIKKYLTDVIGQVLKEIAKSRTGYYAGRAADPNPAELLLGIEKIILPFMSATGIHDLTVPDDVPDDSFNTPVVLLAAIEPIKLNPFARIPTLDCKKLEEVNTHIAVMRQNLPPSSQEEKPHLLWIRLTGVLVKKLITSLNNETLINALRAAAHLQSVTIQLDIENIATCLEACGLIVREYTQQDESAEASSASYKPALFARCRSTASEKAGQNRAKYLETLKQKVHHKLARQTDTNTEFFAFLELSWLLVDALEIQNEYGLWRDCCTLIENGLRHYAQQDTTETTHSATS